MLDKHHPNRQLINKGTQIRLSEIREGQTFRYSFYKSIYQCVGVIDGYVKIKKPCGWIVRLNFSSEKINQIIYLTDHDTD